MKSKMMAKIIAALFASAIIQTTVDAQVKTLTRPIANLALQKKFLNPKIQPLSTQGSINRQNILNTLTFKGKPQKGAGLLPKVNDFKTTRNGRTTEVVPNDGNLGITETAGEKTTEKEGSEDCTTELVTLTAGFNELNLLDPSAAEIWPGRIINIATMDEGSYQSFIDYTRRNDLRIALIAAGASQSGITKTIPGNSVSQGVVVDSVNRIKNTFGTNSFGSQGWMFEDIRYTSMEQFSIEAGLGVAAAAIKLDVRASSSIRNGATKNKIVLKFLREAFVVKVDNDLNEVVVTNNISNNAGIIATVTYGSFGIIEIESDSSFSAIEATLNAAFQAAPGTAINAGMTLAQRQTMTSMSIKGIFKGVDGNQSLRNNLSLDGVRSILTNEVPNFSATTPVVPIAFGIKSLKTGETMMLRSTLSYPRKNCIPIPPTSPDLKVRIKMIAFTCPSVNDGVSSDEDIFGKITVTNGSKKQDVWDKDIKKNVKVKNSADPSKDGAYSLNGRATDFVFTMKTDVESLSRNEISVRVELYDEEWEKGVPYEIRTIKIKHKDIFSILKAPTVTPTNIDWDASNRMFKIVTNEVRNTNKIVTWFNVYED